ncbi:MAG: hypothetical protein HY941_12245 [Gammaproteobacteria bacterium]|nr:hypothetical protein [Gammaproteobacteria bacterium]
MKIEFDLLSNAIDSIQQAIDLLAWRDEPGDARRLKQAVLAIAHGVELLLKERIRQVHPVLVWENVDKFPSLSARTVTVDTTLSRLEKIGGLRINEADCEMIRSLRDTRNAIEHYSWSTTKAEAEQIVGKSLGFALHFAKDQLSYDFFGYHTRKDDTFHVLLGGNSKFTEAFRERYEQRVGMEGRFKRMCNFCHALAVNPSTGACELCGHWNDFEGADDAPF